MNEHNPPPEEPQGQPPQPGPNQYAHLGPTQTGLAPNVAGLLCYLVGWITGLIFLLIEPRNRFVRFHAMQSLIASAALVVLSIAIQVLASFTWFACVFAPLGLIIGLAYLAVWIIGMVTAVQGQWFKFPIVGDIAMNAVGGPDG